MFKAERIWFLVALMLLAVVGCDAPTPPKPKTKTTTSKIATKLATGPKQETTKIVRKRRTKPPEERGERTEPEQTESEFDFSFDSSSNFSYEGGGAFSRSQNESRPGLSSGQIIERVTSLLRDSIEYAPTLAVWLIDESKSARGFVGGVGGTLRQPYSGLKQEADANQFLTAVCTFGQQVRFPVDTPSSDPATLINAFGALQEDVSGKEMLFTAVGESLKKYASYRTSQKREVLFFIVTDEAGDDQTAAEDVIKEVRKQGIPIYVIGVPAPLGRAAAVDASVEVAGIATSIQQGPESRVSEHIELGFWGGMNDYRLVDSGFGPFALERLCRASNGRYIALRPSTTGYSFVGETNTEWPNSGVWQPDPNAMRKYAPDYVSEAEYQAILQANAACMALCNAAKLPRVEFAQLPETTFVKQSEPQLSADVARAQKLAAKLEPVVNRLYDALARGESARDKLTSPRWKASYDLALGRAAAAKARVDGYNAMLAELKRGKNFTDDSHNTWQLMENETTEASSGLKKLCAKAKGYLKGVAKEHPGTPWAKLAERELQTPVGWKWTES